MNWPTQDQSFATGPIRSWVPVLSDGRSYSLPSGQKPTHPPLNAGIPFTQPLNKLRRRPASKASVSAKHHGPGQADGRAAQFSTARDDEDRHQRYQVIKITYTVGE